MKNSFPFLACLIFLMLSCTKDKHSFKPTSLVGKWTLSDVYGNDYWGGPGYWRSVTAYNFLEFTAAGKYYSKAIDEPNFTLIGTYKLLPENKLEITWANPTTPSYPTYVVDYSFEDGGCLILNTGNTESVMKEKYILNH